MLFDLIKLRYVSLRDDNPSGFINRGRIGGLIHLSVYAVVFILSITDLHVMSGSSELSLGLVFLLSGLLGALALARVIMSKEGENTRAIRNLLSSLLLLSSFAALGEHDTAARNLTRSALGWVVALVSVGRIGDVLANKVDPDSEDNENEDPDFVQRQIITYVLIAVSLASLITYKVQENDAALDFTSVREGSNLMAVILISVHLLLNPLNMLYNVLMPNRPMIPLTRSPYARHLVASSVISLLAYSLGCSTSGAGKWIWLLSSAGIYVVADTSGRGIDSVAL